MTETLPEPASREESYLANIAGMTGVTIPQPASRKEEYLYAIATNGGGGGGTSDFDELSNRPKYNGTTMTGDTSIPAVPTVAQSTGSSTTDVMSQDATTHMVYDDPSTRHKVKIGGGAASNVSYCVSLGFKAQATGEHSIAIGGGAYDYESARAQAKGSIAIGAGSFSNTQGVISVGAVASPEYGYNNSDYRLLTGLYDPQSAHDAATKGYVDSYTNGIKLLQITQTDYDNLQNKDANTLYIITGA